MGRASGYLVAALCLFVAYQGYENSRTAAAEAMASQLAKPTACAVDPTCVLSRSQPAVLKSDAFRRRYQYATTVGPVVVTCQRQYIWLGEWECRSEKGSLL